MILQILIGSEVLFSIEASSREEVDEIAKKAEMAGGRIFSEPAEHQVLIYGCGFADLDGHRWNTVYMDLLIMKEI
jgi:predicted lactoylglutathione lyase